jgi:hypothetical protein
MEPAFVALFAFAGSEADELSFTVGDAIAVSSQDDSGWWKGTCKGATGLFPANYVEAATTPAESKPKFQRYQPSPSPPAAPPNQSPPASQQPPPPQSTPPEHAFRQAERLPHIGQRVGQPHQPPAHRYAQGSSYDPYQGHAYNASHHGAQKHHSQLQAQAHHQEEASASAIHAAQARNSGKKQPPAHRRGTYAQGSSYDPFKGHAHNASHHGAQKHHANLQEEVHHQEEASASATHAAQARNRGEAPLDASTSSTYGQGSHYDPFEGEGHAHSSASHHGAQTHHSRLQDEARHQEEASASATHAAQARNHAGYGVDPLQSSQQIQRFEGEVANLEAQLEALDPEDDELEWDAIGADIFKVGASRSPAAGPSTH